MMFKDGVRLWTRQAVAAYWGVSVRTVTKWMEEGKITVYRTNSHGNNKAGRPRFWPQDRLDEEPQEEPE